MFRNIHRFFVALFVQETVSAQHAGRQMQQLQGRIDKVEGDFAEPDGNNRIEVSEQARLLLDAAKKQLADAKATIEKPSKSKFVRSWRLLEAYDLASAGANLTNRAFWTWYMDRMLNLSDKDQTQTGRGNFPKRRRGVTHA
jgi:hypothetical protein